MGKLVGYKIIRDYYSVDDVELEQVNTFNGEAVHEVNIINEDMSREGLFGIFMDSHVTRIYEGDNDVANILTWEEKQANYIKYVDGVAECKRFKSGSDNKDYRVGDDEEVIVPQWFKYIAGFGFVYGLYVIARFIMIIMEL